MMFYYEEMGRISYFICRILYYKCLLYKGKQHVPLVRDGNEQNRVCGVLGIGIWKSLLVEILIKFSQTKLKKYQFYTALIPSKER